jgi:hypothetical protein
MFTNRGTVDKTTNSLNTTTVDNATFTQSAGNLTLEAGTFTLKNASFFLGGTTTLKSAILSSPFQILLTGAPSRARGRSRLTLTTVPGP